jgi:hypothetical protein
MPVLIAGFSPIPFKIITIASGICGSPFPGLLGAAIACRGTRLILEGAPTRWGGMRLCTYGERHDERMTMPVVWLVIGGFVPT